MSAIISQTKRGRPGKFSNEQRAEAIRLVMVEKLSLADAERRTGVSRKTIRTWMPENYESGWRTQEQRDADRQRIIDLVRGYVENDNIHPTARTVYYQHVARSWLTSGETSYEQVLRDLSFVRDNGLMPFDWISDGGRELRTGCNAERRLEELSEADVSAQAWSRILGAVRGVGWELRPLVYSHRWAGQRYHVSVIFEKDALTSVFEAPCADADVSWFALRGSCTRPIAYEWVAHVADAVHLFPGGAIILYAGDHDPDGIQIPRSMMEMIANIQEVTGLHFPVKLDRFALNFDQTQHFSPFPAKESSNNFDKYVEEFGTEQAWELDAIEPRRLQEMTLEKVSEYFDEEVFDRNQKQVNEIERRNRDIVERALGGPRDRVLRMIEQMRDQEDDEDAGGGADR